MNVTSTNPVIQVNSSSKAKQAFRVEADVLRLDKTNNNVQSEQNRRPKESIRVIRVASDDVKVSEFGAKDHSINKSQTRSQIKPEEHYQINQQLLEKEEIGALLGVDVFA